MLDFARPHWRLDSDGRYINDHNLNYAYPYHLDAEIEWLIAHVEAEVQVGTCELQFWKGQGTVWVLVFKVGTIPGSADCFVLPMLDGVPAWLPVEPEILLQSPNFRIITYCPVKIGFIVEQPIEPGYWQMALAEMVRIYFEHNPIDTHAINGRINVNAEYDQNGNIVERSFEWEGGDIIGVTPEFLRDADPRWVRRHSDEVQIGPFRVKILAMVSLGHFSDGREHLMYICQRIYE